ncbi:MAG TPA: P-loop NTPase [Acidimicrobiia bacterium]|nr:P-loop NTPase [Acidimicrobiia bacterium]
MESFATVAPPGAETSSFDVAVIEPDYSLRTRLAVELAEAGQFETIEELLQHLHPGRPVVVVFGPSFVSPMGFQHVHRLTGAHPEIGAVFAASELSTEVLQQALRAGARDAVVIGGEASLHQSVDRVGELLAGSVSRSQAPATRTGEPGRLVVVFSTKGGVGKTCIAINVAVAMARRSTDPVVLVDGDLQFGDVSVMLGLPPQHTVLDAAAAAQYGDMELVQTLAARHDSGLLVLPAPIEPIPTDAMLPGEMVNICSALQSMAGHVVVDLPSVFNDYVLALIEAADEVLLVGSMDIPSIKNLKIGMQTLDLNAIAGSKLRLVLNHANAKVKLDVKEIERVLGLSANFPVPDDLAVPMSVNAGVPVLLEDPKAPVSRALDRIAEALLGSAARTGSGRRGK